MDEYFRKLNKLAKEYDVLSQQLDPTQVDEALINNLIDNLQMRLQLMIALKKELKSLKSKNNEKITV